MLRWTAQRLKPILVPPGRNTPLNESPSGGTIMSNVPVTGGKILRLSLIQACRYGKALASESLIGLEMLPAATAPLISAVKRQSTLGVVVKKRIVALIAAAEVSDPANLSQLMLVKRSTGSLAEFKPYNCNTVSDSASSWLSPCFKNDPSISCFTFLSSPNLSATLTFAMAMIFPSPI